MGGNVDLTFYSLLLMTGVCDISQFQSWAGSSWAQNDWNAGKRPEVGGDSGHGTETWGSLVRSIWFTHHWVISTIFSWKNLKRQEMIVITRNKELSGPRRCKSLGPDDVLKVSPWKPQFASQFSLTWLDWFISAFSKLRACWFCRTTEVRKMSLRWSSYRPQLIPGWQSAGTETVLAWPLSVTRPEILIVGKVLIIVWKCWSRQKPLNHRQTKPPKPST